MRRYALAVAAAAIASFPVPGFSQAVEIGPGGVEVDPGYPYHHGRSVSRRDCKELREACIHKEDLGEQGRGNCERYRRLCRGE